MLTGSTVFVIIILFCVFFIFYKRDMLAKMLSLNAAFPAGELQNQLEKTADMVIKRLETQIAHLEMLLDEADTKMAILDEKLHAADIIIRQHEEIPAPRTTVDFRLPAEHPAVLSPVNPTLAEESAVPRDNKDSLNSDKRRLVLNMAEQGYSVTDIAKSTGVGKGEIMLLLQLNRK